MSVRTLTANLLTALAMLSGFASVHAQEYFPAQDPFAFDPDFQWFEPVSDMDLADMKPSKRANTGWFATYDRLNLYVSRPELGINRATDPGAPTKLDSGWGHRYEVGYMLPDEDKGWLFNWTDMNVFEGFFVPRERINRVNLDDLTDPPGGIVGPPFGLIVPAADANTPGLNTRTYVFVGHTENAIDYDSYELNKTWRMEPYHYGGILEPMVGVRWMSVNDANVNYRYNSTEDFQEGAPIPFQVLDTNGMPIDDVEQLQSDYAYTDNDIITAQLGFHYTKFRDRFTFSGDFRAFFGAAYQCSKTNQFTTLTFYDGNDIGAGVDQIINRSEQTGWSYERNEEFVIGFDVRGELAYQLTKSISVRGGFQVIDIARGLWRGGSINPNNTQLIGGDNDQDLVMVGGTLGLTLNR